MADMNDWEGRLGRAWAELNAATDRQLAEVAEILAARLEPHPGERVLDLGCGAGTTSAGLAAAVAPGGMVTGLDISPDLLALARQRHAGVPGLAFVEADAARHAFPPAGFDALHSRMGCMFFDDPAAAFANIRTGLIPGARIAMAAFADPADNPWATVPIEAAAPLLEPTPPAPGVPGPFAWSDPAVFQAALAAAGFREIAHEPREVRFAIGVDGPGSPVDRAIALMTRIGVLARRLAVAPEGTEARLRPLLEAALAPHVDGDWVRLPARFWLITARA
ncbi:methyltransferase domain-containing protein [Paralimibaculum aggregatum]|uniref:Methyltransferase domain-containing protein n=1 Tax=Paralimibaculum aggregatum TaxID=3036245 RepID=A0ABQ6LMM6_9RHOB|nr:methyltransferase domain-containing protein [Limibaculum sp. NKW23]GMG81899.1 methyltransferase domain-containing protein [Limibaculum sp. NKW23]